MSYLLNEKMRHICSFLYIPGIGKLPLTKISDCVTDGLFYSGFSGTLLPQDPDLRIQKFSEAADFLYFRHSPLLSFVPDSLCILTAHLTVLDCVYMENIHTIS